jgi:dipeptidase E
MSELEGSGAGARRPLGTEARPVHVLAMGGGGGWSPLGPGGIGSSAGRQPRPLLRFALSLAKKETPRVCFIPTATGDAERSILAFYTAMSRFQCIPSHLTLFHQDMQVADVLADQDVIYVGGGNTANLLAIWRLHGVDRLLSELAQERGLVVCGGSAGGLCWFECGVTDSFGPQLAALNDGLCWLPGSFCPHYDNESSRRPTYERLIESGSLPAGWAVDDAAALHFVNGEFRSALADRPEARVYRVQKGEAGVVEEAQAVLLLRDGQAEEPR